MSKKNMLNEKKASELMMENDEHSPDKEDIADHEVESAAHDLMRAEMHKANPHMMKKVHAHLAKKKAAITSIEGLKSARNGMFTKKD